MMKKGFTLIELLAVIIILAIISLIVTPMISNLIQNARKATARTSAQGYIDAVKNKISLSVLDKQNIHGIHAVSELDSVLEYSGTRVERGIVIVDGDILEEAKLCVNGYSFKYYSDKLEESNIDYCVDKSNLEITVLGTSIEEELNNQYSYDLDLTSYDISSATNVVCNNNAIPSVTNDTLHITDIYGDTKCSIENSIATTFANLDDTTNNIVMIKDENITAPLNILEGKNVVLELNGNKIESVNSSDPSDSDTTYSDSYYVFIVNGYLVINATNGGSIVSHISSEAIVVKSTGNLIINDGYYNGRRSISSSGITTVNNGTFASKGNYDAVYVGGGTTTLNDGTYNSKIRTDKACTININGGHYELDSSQTGNVVSISGPGSGVVNINGGVFISVNSSTINNSSTSGGIININGGVITSQTNFAVYNSGSSAINIMQTDAPMHITTLAQAWKPAIVNSSTGTINITANQANACTSDVADTTSGLCVYAEGNRATSGNTGNAAMQNISAGTISIDGGTYFGWHQCVNNNSTGVITIKNANISSNYIAVLNNSSGGTGVVNVENSNMNAVYTVANRNAGEFNIKSGRYESTDVTLANAAGTLNVTGGIFISNITYVLANTSTGIVNITQTDTPIYISTLAQAWRPAINNNSSGTINITANQANACTATASDTTSGLCVYAEGDKNYTTGSANVALVLGDTSTGAININGGTYYGGNVTVSASGGTANIRNAKLLSGYYAILGINTSAINICNSSIETPSHDIYVRTAGPVINYTSDVVFRNGTNTPTITTNNGTINAVATCPITE